MLESSSSRNSSSGRDEDALHVPQEKQSVFSFDRTQVIFHVRCPIAQPGDVVCLLGNVKDLGEWDERKCIPMKKLVENEESSKWTITLSLESGILIEYKYILFRNGVILLWETLKGNFTFSPGSVNVAIEKPSEQSSTYVALESPGITPSSVSGNGAASSAHTHGRQHQPWWQVDLLQEYPISHIALWNRQDHTMKQLFPVWILISQVPFGNCTLQEAKSKAECCQRFLDVHRPVQWYPSSHQSNASSSKSSESVKGRYVRVQLEETGVLHFDEVEVFHRINTSNLSTLKDFCPKMNNIIDQQQHEQHEQHEKKVQHEQHEKEDQNLSYKDNQMFHKLDDTLFGMDHRFPFQPLMIDEGWLGNCPRRSEVRIILGSLVGTKSIEMKNNQERYYLEMHVTKQCNGSSISNNFFESSGDFSSIPQEDDEITEIHRPHSFVKAGSQKDFSFAPFHKMKSSLEKTSSSLSQEHEFLSPNNLKKLSCFVHFSMDQMEKITRAFERVEIMEAGKALFITEDQLSNSLYLLFEGEVAVFSGETTPPPTSAETTTTTTNPPTPPTTTLVPGDCFGQLGSFNNGISSLYSSKKITFCTLREKTIYFRLDNFDFAKLLGKDEYLAFQEKMILENYSTDHSRCSSNNSKNISSTTSNSIKEESKCDEEEKDTVVSEWIDADVQFFKIPLDNHNPCSCCSFSSSFYLGTTTTTWSLQIHSMERKNQTLLGQVLLLPSQWSHSTGQLTLPIVSDHGILGQCTFQYTVIHSFQHPQNTLQLLSSSRNHWEYDYPLMVGHRGMGRSYHQAPGYRPACLLENTVASFAAAGQVGADFVELDVHLTQDRIPIIYHDYYVQLGLQDAKLHNGPEPIQMGIHQLTLRHLRFCKAFPVNRHQTNSSSSSLKLKNLVQKYWHHLLASKSSTKLHHLRHPYPMIQFPTLQEALEQVPENVGFNVEIKYPIEKENYHLRKLDAFEMNSYVDYILQVVYEHAHHRRIIFSCFDPDLCSLLRAKQPRYPVLFLTCGGAYQEHYLDSRCLSVESAMHFAKLDQLQGIVSNSTPLLENPKLIDKVKNQQLLLFTWGNRNTEYHVVEYQKNSGIDAIISDNVGDLVIQHQKESRQKNSCENII